MFCLVVFGRAIWTQWIHRSPVRTVPPRIHYVSHTATLDVLQGQPVRIECRASGNPVPAIAWTRKNGDPLPGGERGVTGTAFTVAHADRRTIGQYRCTADNGVGTPDSRIISVNVLCKYIPSKGTCITS